MPRYYTYLISSLPMLHFGMKPPFSYAKFLSKCADMLAQEELQLLSLLPDDNFSCADRLVIKEWQEFDMMLRNELAKLRAARKKIEPQKYLRLDGYSHPFVYHIAQAAYRLPHILEGEELLDRQRWNFLDELAVGHYFDLDYLIVYAYKLLILERWDKIHSAPKQKLLEEAVSF